MHFESELISCLHPSQHSTSGQTIESCASHCFSLVASKAAVSTTHSCLLQVLLATQSSTLSTSFPHSPLPAVVGWAVGEGVGSQSPSTSKKSNPEHVVGQLSPSWANAKPCKVQPYHARASSAHGEQHRIRGQRSRLIS